MIFYEIVRKILFYTQLVLGEKKSKRMPIALIRSLANHKLEQ